MVKLSARCLATSVIVCLVVTTWPAEAVGARARASTAASTGDEAPASTRADDDPGTGPVSAYRMPRVRVGYGDGIDVFAAAMERASAPEDE